MTFRKENKKIKSGYEFIIGCDEVGRGCLAGPVVAGAVVFNKAKINAKGIMAKEIKDSKLLTANKRLELSKNIKDYCLAWSIAEVSSGVIDKLNIHNASLLAMKKSVEKLSSELERVYLFVDGKFPIPNFAYEQEPVIDGDNKILCIAAASIIAKVYRDGLMTGLHKQYPVYNFYQHKGYGTLLHRTMIAKYGLSQIHRKSFCQKLSA
jgi:ribonuclease HII